MKKFLLSLAVSLAFIFYVYTKHSATPESNNAVLPPVSLQTNPTPTPSSPPAPVPNPTPSPGPTPDSTPSPVPTPPPPPKPAGQYIDGSYTGPAADAFYGLIQVKAIISGGKITDVIFLQYPNDRSTSRSINKQAMPYLKTEAIQAQSASVNIVSGATDSSIAFRESLKGALLQAKN